MTWETTIGLEVHVQLLTKSKIFSSSPTGYGAEPNTKVGLLDFGLPGTLPVLNAEVLKMAVKFGLAVSGDIAPYSIFARKNYFYPDLPKGYQISQQDDPIIKNGFLDIILEDGSTKRVFLERAHLEEDAGKSIHGGLQGKSGIDLNRAGMPLLEIVSKPELCNAKEAVAYLKTLHTLVRYLDICDGNMQEGSFRCDTNVSIRRQGAATLGTRVEIKNVNSFRFVERAITYEIQRQIETLESGGTIIQETRLYDESKDETRAMRTKEMAKDYRYFPDPDLLPVYINDQYINEIKAILPELPQQKYTRFISQYGLSQYDTNILISQKNLAIFYENAVIAANNEAKLMANWVIGDLLGALNKENLDITQSPISAEQLGGLILRISDQTISGKIAKTVFEAMWQKVGTADFIIEKQNLNQVVDPLQISVWIDEVMTNSPTQVASYRDGKTQLFGYFIGQVMKISLGKANPEKLNELLKIKLHA